MADNVVSIDPEVMSGAPVFPGTRILIATVFDYLEGGDSIEEFLEGFPTVSRAQVMEVLENAKARVSETAR